MSPSLRESLSRSNSGFSLRQREDMKQVCNLTESNLNGKSIEEHSGLIVGRCADMKQERNCAGV